MRKGYGIVEATCRRCGKKFIVEPFHIYKRGKLLFCRYNCYNAYLNEVDANKHQGKKKGDRNEA